MRILVYAHLFPPAKGGMEYSNLEIARGLSRIGHEVEVAARWNPGIESLIARLDFPVRVLPAVPGAPAHSIVGRGRWNWLLWRRYRATLSQMSLRLRPDAVLVADETSNAFWGSWPERRLRPYVAYCSVPFVAIRKNRPGRFGMVSRVKNGVETRISDRFRRWMMRSYQDAARMVAVSRSTRNLLAGTAPELASKIVVVPRSVDDVFFHQSFAPADIAELRRRMGIEEGDAVLLTVTNLLREKGVEDILYAIGSLSPEDRRGLRLVIVGGGPDRERLVHLAAELPGVAERTVFAGARSHSELPGFYDLCDLFVLPSRRGEAESFGRVFAEAAACAIPSVGVDAGGMTDVIRDGETGFLTSAGDRQALAEIFRQLRKDPDRFREMGRRAQAFARVRFTSRAVARQMAEVLAVAANFPFRSRKSS